MVTKKYCLLMPLCFLLCFSKYVWSIHCPFCKAGQAEPVAAKTLIIVKAGQPYLCPLCLTAWQAMPDFSGPSDNQRFYEGMVLGAATGHLLYGAHGVFAGAIVSGILAMVSNAIGYHKPESHPFQKDLAGILATKGILSFRPYNTDDFGRRANIIHQWLSEYADQYQDHQDSLIAFQSGLALIADYFSIVLKVHQEDADHQGGGGVSIIDGKLHFGPFSIGSLQGKAATLATRKRKHGESDNLSLSMHCTRLAQGDALLINVDKKFPIGIYCSIQQKDVYQLYLPLYDVNYVFVMNKEVLKKTIERIIRLPSRQAVVSIQHFHKSQAIKKRRVE